MKYLIGIILASIVLLGINLLIIFISELRHVDQHNYTYATLSKFLIYMFLKLYGNISLFAFNQ